MPITFITIAQDESANIQRCIASARGIGVEHIVIDGGSLDDTADLALAAGARVINRKYVSSSDQYNFGLDECKSTWAFVLDSDEELDEELRSCLLGLDLERSELAAYDCARKNLWVGRWVRHGAWYPDYNLRLLNVATARYERRAVHARVVFQGETGRLDGNIVHRTYTSISHYLRKLDRFTDKEVRARKTTAEVDVERRSSIRAVWLRTPFRPLTRFLIDYFVRRGFLDGRVGLDIAVSAAYYEYVVGMKIRYGVEVRAKLERS